MRLFTEVQIPDAPFSLEPGASIVSIGSCFADIITEKFESSRFEVLKNPFGTLYNPLSISRNISHALLNQPWKESDLFCYQERFLPLSHATSFNSDDPSNCLKRLRECDEQLRQGLEKASLLIITLGTAWCYHLKEDDSIAGNCHKLPNTLFERKLLSPEQIRDSLAEMIELLNRSYPKLEIIFTVSPVRHVRDSMIDNSRSKGALLYAIGELCDQFPQIYYFPSYEIVMDELRDYRFYDESLTHPAAITREIIWEKLSEKLFSPETKLFTKEFRKIHAALNHKINSESDNAVFAQRSLERVARVENRFSLNLSREANYFTELLENPGSLPPK